MKTLTLLLLCLIINNSQAQFPGWIPLPDSNATWCAQRGFLVTGNPDAFHTYNYIQHIDGDTLINGLVYHKIYESGILDVMAIPPTSWTYTYYNNVYVGCIRENNNKQAFRIPNYSSAESLLYDFNLQVGDTVDLGNEIIISGIDSIYDGTNYRQRFKLSYADSSLWPDPLYYEHVSWIEGIGSTGGNFFSLGPYFEHGGILYEFSHIGISYYQDPITSCSLTLNTNVAPNIATANVYPNPFTDRIEIDLVNKTSGEITFEIFDVTGQKQDTFKLRNANNVVDLGNLSSGFYFYRLYEGAFLMKSGKLIKQ